MVKVYDSLVSPVECRPSAMSVSMCCYERFNELLLAFQCVAVSVSMSCYERYGLALLLTMQRYYIFRAPLPYRVLLVTTLPYLDQVVSPDVHHVHING